jgi:flagellar hook-length control protein FliK
MRDGLRDPIGPAETMTGRLTEGLAAGLTAGSTAGLTERLTERAADHPADPAARIDTMLRADPASRLESPPLAAERAGPVPVLYAEHGLGSPEWQREFGSQVSLLVSRREPLAEIRINPPQLGPVEVRIGLQGDQVTLAFTAPHPDTRAAIENALPQLREMFAGNGLALGNASVSAESSQQQAHRGTHQNEVSRPNGEPMLAESVPPMRGVAVRLVDTFA